MKHILYICAPSSIHDIKWMSFFSVQKEKFKIYVIYEKGNQLDESTRHKLKNAHIQVLNPIDSFSITHPLKNYRSVHALKKAISQCNIDLVHVLFATPHAIWTNYLSIPYIITTRGSDILIVLPKLLRKKGLKKIYFHWLYKQFKKAFEGALFVTCTSQVQIDKTKELFRIDNIHLIRTGIDIEKIQMATNRSLLPSSLLNSPFIFSPRFFSPIYNIQLQIDALKELPLDFIGKFVFVFIRGKNYEPKYSESIEKQLVLLSKKMNLSYIIESHLEQESLWTYYNYAALCIMTPVSDGTPNSALEAMAAKCPLIIPNLDYDADLFENSSAILNENEPKELALLIQRTIVNYSDDLILNAFAKVSQFGNRKIEMKKLERLYL